MKTIAYYVKLTIYKIIPYRIMCFHQHVRHMYIKNRSAYKRIFINRPMY